jgi:hypothetical protein
MMQKMGFKQGIGLGKQGILFVVVLRLECVVSRYFRSAAI